MLINPAICMTHSTLQSNFPGRPFVCIACDFLKEQGHKGRGLSSEENENLNREQDIDVTDTGKESRKNNWHSRLTIFPRL